MLKASSWFQSQYFLNFIFLGLFPLCLFFSLFLSLHFFLHEIILPLIAH